MAEELQRVLEKLRNERLIVIFVGKDAKPFRIQQCLLEGVSEHFKRVFENEERTSDESGTLSFPEDDISAWEQLVYWMVTSNMSSITQPSNDGESQADLAERQLLLVRCWAIGEKYAVCDFRETIMSSLLAGAGVEKHFRVEAITEAFATTPPGSRLRLLMAEDVARQLNYHHSMKFEDLDSFGSLPSVTSEVVDAVSRWHEDCGDESDRLCATSDTTRFCSFHSAVVPKEDSEVDCGSPVKKVSKKKPASKRAVPRKRKAIAEPDQTHMSEPDDYWDQ
ncbi:hypothetical protein LTR10_000677 [Elasticomyces elasticus]|nr:hypothetical protein LTR10_000677 [Elasticomyces elasticus]KAK4980075.1 hypothetical protein LTR42_000382 [Elasticomyces elasticus]